MIHLSLRQNIAEIKASKALRLFGISLALCNFVTIYAWLKGPRGAVALMTGPSELYSRCWPFFQNCHEFLPLNEVLVKSLYFAFFFFNSLSLFFFLRQKVSWGYILCWGTFILKLFFFFSNHSLNGNYHYMAILVQLLFLVAARKEATIPLLLVGLYFSAGLLKLTPEWISGAAMIARPMFEGKWIEIACAFVVYYELLLIWGLLSTRFYLFWGVFYLTLTFHAFSWHLVGYLYPMTMFFLVMIFPLLRLYKSGERPSYVNRSSLAWLGLLLLCQLLPYLYPGDHAIHGQGRMIKLHMFDAYSQCQHRAILHQGNTHYELPLRIGSRVRGQCSVYSYFMRLKEYCEYRIDKSAPISFSFAGKRTTESEFKQIVLIDNICRDDIRYNGLLPNDWILSAGRMK